MNYLYLRGHFSWLPQAVGKELIYRLSQKISYAYKRIVPVIDVFSPNEVTRDLKICDHSIVILDIRGFCLDYSITYCVDSLDRFRKPGVDKVKSDICILKTENHLKMIIQYENELVSTWGYVIL